MSNGLDIGRGETGNPRKDPYMSQSQLPGVNNLSKGEKKLIVRSFNPSKLNI